jgi:hypothetical protein
MSDEVWLNRQNVGHHLYNLFIPSNFQKTLDFNIPATPFKWAMKLNHLISHSVCISHTQFVFRILPNFLFLEFVQGFQLIQFKI